MESKPFALPGAALGEVALALLAAGLEAGLVAALGVGWTGWGDWAALATLAGFALALAALATSFDLTAAAGKAAATAVSFSAFAGLLAAEAVAGAAGLVPLRLAAGDADLPMLFFFATTTS